MLRILAFLMFLGPLLGCRDSADSIARDYRNANSEAIDAMMMSSTLDQAETMAMRILMYYPARIEAIDRRVTVWKQNSETDDRMTQIVGSDQVALLIVEREINLKRLAIESDRKSNITQVKEPFRAKMTEIRDKLQKQLSAEGNDLLKNQGVYLNLETVKESDDEKLRKFFDFKKLGAAHESLKVMWPAFKNKVSTFERIASEKLR